MSARNFLRLIAYAGLMVGAFLAAYRLPISYRYEDMKDYLGLLSGASGMVFTLMGIWIAFLYPNALSRLVNPEKVEIADFSETLQETRRLENIVAAILKSALVMLGAMFVLLVKIVLYKTGVYLQYLLLFKSVALSFIIGLSFAQAEAVLSVVFANVMFINDLHYKRRLRQVDVAD